MDAGEVHQLNHQVVAVGGQEVDALALLPGLVHHGLQLAHGRTVSHSALAGHVGHAIYLAKPYDVVDADVVAHECLAVGIYVYHTHQPLAVLSVEIQERAVLAEPVTVGGIVGWRVVVAEEQHQSAAQTLFQRLTPLYVDFFVE